MLEVNSTSQGRTAYWYYLFLFLRDDGDDAYQYSYYCTTTRNWYLTSTIISISSIWLENF